MRGSLFQCDPDIRLAGTEVFLDPAEPRAVGVISHGHSDHIGRHGRFIATAPTAAILRIREGHDLRGTELVFGATHREGPYTIELLPAGHVLGSAMVHVRGEAGTLLYTGDFRLRPSLTAEPAVVPDADAVITESTYGSPEWRFPPREETAAQLVELAKKILGRGRVPVVLAYALGKSQEACAILTRAGLRVVLHPSVARIAEVYVRAGVDLGPWNVWASQQTLFGADASPSVDGAVLILPPHLTRELRRVGRCETIAVTGWALHRPMPADHAIPLSDHADFDELLELVERSRAKVVYVTHGSRAFAKELRRRGISAEYLKRDPQMRMF